MRIENLSKAYPDKVVLKNFSAEFPDGEVSCIMGKSGSGKTTLLRIILGLEKADSGSVGTDKFTRFSAVFQEDRLCEQFTAEVNVRLVCRDGERVRAVLTEMGLGDSLDKPVSELSGGMKRRTAIARCMLAQSDIIIMDEPFKGLDEDTRERVISTVLRLREGRTMIVSTHDPEEAALLGGRIVTVPMIGEEN